MCETLAKLYNVEPSTIAAHSTANFYSLFDIAGRQVYQEGERKLRQLIKYESAIN